MSYGVSAALQTAIFGALQADGALGALVGGAIFDAAPVGAVPSTYVTLGPEAVRDRSDASGPGAQHDFTVSVVTDVAGFQTAKAIAAAVSDVLLGAPLTVSRGRVVGVWFRRAQARRVERSTVRRIDMTFRARVEDQ